jgi:hypothetical protein
VDATLDVSDAAGEVAPDADACPSADAAPADAAVSDLCAELASLPCVSPQAIAGCSASVQAWLAQESACCLPALHALIACGAEHGLRCALLSDDILYQPACAAIEEAYDVCSGSHDNCTQILMPVSGGLECLTECDQYAADCSGPTGGPYGCTCTFGPKSGTSFVIASCTNLPVDVALACK